MTVVTWWVPGAMAFSALVLLVLGLIGRRRAGPRHPAAPVPNGPVTPDTAPEREPHNGLSHDTSARGIPWKTTNPFASRATPMRRGAFRNTVHRIPNRPALRRERCRPAGRRCTWADYGRGVARGHGRSGRARHRARRAGRDLLEQPGRVARRRLRDAGQRQRHRAAVPDELRRAGRVHPRPRRGARVLRREPRAAGQDPRGARPAARSSSGSSSSTTTSGSTTRSSSASRAARASARRGCEREPGLFDERADAVEPEQLATLVYTSGTTGAPKGTMISHANIMWTIRSAASCVHVHEGERFLSFLPL